MKIRPLLLALALLLGLGVLLPPPATAAPAAPAPAAQGKGLITFGIGPSGAIKPDNRPYLTYGVSAGSTVQDNVAIFNQSDTPLTLLVYPGDGINTEGGGLDIVKRSARNTDIGAWVTVGDDSKKAGLDPTSRSQVTVTVPPQSSKGVGFVVVPVRIAVPADASPGDHVGGIAVSLITQGDSATAQNIELEQRVVTRIYLQVAGDLKPQLAVKVLKASYAGGGGLGLSGDVKVRYRITNTGNTRLGATTRVQVKGLLGVGSRAVDGPKTDELVPGGSADLMTTVTDVPPTVFASAKVSVEAAAPPGAELLEVTPASSSVRVWAVTWQELVLLLLLALGAGGSFWQRRRRRLSPSPKGKHTAQTGPKRVKPKVGVHRRRLGAAFVGTVVGVLGAGQASAAAPLGPVFVEPQKGTDTTLFHGAVGEAQCPKGTEEALFDVIGDDIGEKVPHGSQMIGFLGQAAVPSGTVEFGNNAVVNLRTVSPGAFTHSGTYRIRLRCMTGADQKATYETKLEYTAGGAGSFRIVGNGKRPTTPAALPTSGPYSIPGGTGGGKVTPGTGSVTPSPSAAASAAPDAAEAQVIGDAPDKIATQKVSAQGSSENSQKSTLAVGGLLGVAGLLALAWLALGRRKRA